MNERTSMDEIRTLKAQIEALEENLVRVRQAIETERINPDLREAVKYRFEWKACESERKLQALRAKVDCGEVRDVCWKEFSGLRKDFEGYFRECLVFLEGALMRSAGLDNKVCEVADALLRKLSKYADCEWTRFTIMADDELFVDISEIIRLRFPEFSVWHLPIVAHELGHFVADKLDKESQLFAKLMEEEDPGACNERTLHEQFADFFAVNALGPAFVCSCIFLYFNPMRIFQGRSGHLPDNERVHFILKALEKIDGPNRDFRWVIDKLNSLWQCSLKAAKIQGSLTPEQTASFDKRLDKFRS